MDASDEHEPRPAISRSTIDDEPSKQALNNAPHSHSQTGTRTRSTFQPQPDVISPKSTSSEQGEEDSRSLTNRYQKALGLGDTTLSSSTRTNESQNLNTRQKIVGAGADLFSSTDEGDFNWDDSDESELDEAEREERQRRKLQAQHHHLEHENHLRRARRLRKAYLFFMRLSRPTRTALILILGCSITITLSFSVFSRVFQLCVIMFILADFLFNHIIQHIAQLSLSSFATPKTQPRSMS